MLLVIIFIAFLLRLINLNQSLWLDEAINLNNVSALGFRELMLNYSLSDFHPPLYHLVLKTWVNFFGNSEISARAHSIIFALGSILFVYLIGKKLYDAKTGLISALLLATAPLHVYYSQEARMYMLAAFLTTVSVYFFLSIFEKDKLYNWLGFITSTALVLYTDYLPYLIIPVYILYLIIIKRQTSRHTLISFIPAFSIIVILLVPWLIILPKQLQVGLSVAAAFPAWASVVGSGSLKDFFLSFVKFTIGRISNDNNLVYALIFTPVGCFVAFLSLLSLFRISPKRSFIYLWFLMPLVLAFVISLYVPVFSYFRFIFILPAFYIIWASAINIINWGLPTRTLLAGALTVNLTATFIYLVNPRFQRENWKEAVAYVTSRADKYTITLFESEHPAAPFDYYNRGKVQAQGTLEGLNADREYIKKRLSNLLDQKSKIYLFQYLSPLTDPQGLVFQEITSLGFNNTYTKNFNGVGFVYEFAR